MVINISVWNKNPHQRRFAHWGFERNSSRKNENVLYVYYRFGEI